MPFAPQALSLADTGDYDKAIELHERSLDIDKKTLGDSHPQTLASMGNLGGALTQTGRSAEGAVYLESAIDASAGGTIDRGFRGHWAGINANFQHGGMAQLAAWTSIAWHCIFFLHKARPRLFLSVALA